MNIVFYAPNIYPCSIGGMEIYNYYLISYWANYHSVTLLSNCTLNSNMIMLRELPLKERLLGIRRFGLDTLSTAIYYLFSKRIQWSKVDVLIVPYTSNFGYRAIGILLLHYIYNVKYVLHIHGGGQRPWRPKFLHNLLFQNAAVVIGVSESIVNDYSSRANRPVHYLPPLIPFKHSELSKVEAKHKLGLSSWDIFVLYVGSLKELKSPHTLIDAFFALGHDFIEANNVALVFVGDGPLKKEIHEKVGASIFKNHVLFTGSIRNEHVKDYYRAADVYVIPSIFEGTPIALLEAMFNGLFCIGSNVRGINGIIENNHNGILFSAKQSAELAKALKRSLLSNSNNEYIRSNALDYYSKHFSYSNHAHEYIDLISEVLCEEKG